MYVYTTSRIALQIHPAMPAGDFRCLAAATGQLLSRRFGNLSLTSNWLSKAFIGRTTRI